MREVGNNNRENESKIEDEMCADWDELMANLVTEKVSSFVSQCLLLRDCRTQHTHLIVTKMFFTHEKHPMQTCLRFHPIQLVLGTLMPCNLYATIIPSSLSNQQILTKQDIGEGA